MDEMCCGWLTKSPSSKYVSLFSRSRFHIQIPLRTKWHRRYFVLSKPQGSLPHQYRFDYYKDERRTRRRGTINLEDCTNILYSLDSSHYRYLFSLKTLSSTKHSKERVYYLAADTKEEMDRWVTILSKLCGLHVDLHQTPTNAQENHSIAPNPPERLDSMQLTVDLSTSDISLVNEKLSNEILDEIDAIEQGRVDINHQPMSDHVPEGYTELAECSTGDPIEVYDVPRSAQSTATNRFQSQSVKMPGSALQIVDSTRSTTLPNRIILNGGDSPPPPRPPKSCGKHEELYQNISASPSLSRAASTLPPHTSPNPSLHSSPHPSQHSSPHPARWHSDFDSEPNSPRNLHARTPSPLPRTSHSPAPSPSARKRETQSQSSPFSSPPASARSKKYSVDSLYHNNVMSDITLTASQPDDTRLTTASAGSSVLNETRDSMHNLDVIYDIPKSVAVEQPPPPKCPGNLATHKYVNASTKVIVCDGDCMDGNTEDAFTNDSQSDLTSVFVNQSCYYSEGAAKNEECSPRRASVGATAPARPPKPRNLSDTMVLDDQRFSNDSRSVGVIKVSKSFKTKVFTREQPHRDSMSTSHVSVSSSRDDIQLPMRITRGSTSSSSSACSSADDESEEIKDKLSSTKPTSNNNLYQTPSSVAISASQPDPPIRLHKTPYSDPQVSALSSVKRANSMPKVLPPLQSSPITKYKTAQNCSSSSPRLKRDPIDALRSHRSPSVSAIDSRKQSLTNINKLIPRVAQDLSSTHLQPVSDIQYIELEQPNSQPELSPGPQRASFSHQIPSSSKGATTELEYIDIDMFKTQALMETRKDWETERLNRSENLTAATSQRVQ